MFQSGMSCQNGIVRFDNSGGDLWGGVDRKFEFRFFAIVNREPFHEQRGKTGASSATERVENEKTLKTGAVVRQFADAVQHVVDYFFADCVVATGVVVGRILLAGDQLFGMVEIFVLALTD